MSRLLSRARNRASSETGFTLIEIIVALTLLGLTGAATAPLLIVGMRAATISKLNTQAKNLAQARLESMRDLQFHVDRQNGPFIDLLDIYYTNLVTTPTTRVRANESEVGKWVSGGATAPAPSGAFYQISVAQLPGYPAFSQTIDTQFLDATGAALPSSGFANYDSQTEGRDQPPSLMVGVTVITTWTDHGVSHSYPSYTRISDERGLVSSLTSQGTGEFLRVSSTGLAGNSLTVDVASAEASGDQSTGSDASADVRSLQASDENGTDYLGATGVATSPGGSSTGSATLGGFTAGTGGDCGWIGVGPTQVGDVTASVNGGLPKAPSDVDTSSPPTKQVVSQLTSGGNNACGIFGFSNQSMGFDPSLMLDPDMPLVRIDNDPQNNVVVSGSAWVNATSASTSPHSVTSGSNASSTKRLQVFPGASFVTDGFGVVDVRLSQSSISCLSSVTSGATTQSSSGSWTATIDYWRSTDTSGGGSRVTLPTYTWNSASNTGSADPLAAIDPASIIVYQNGSTVLHLSDYIASWNTARSIVENATSGIHQLSSIVGITTQPVRAGDLLSAVGVELGNLSCAADDER